MSDISKLSSISGFSDDVLLGRKSRPSGRAKGRSSVGSQSCETFFRRRSFKHELIYADPLAVRRVGKLQTHRWVWCKCLHNTKVNLRQMHQSVIVLTVMMLLSVFALFGDDVRLWLFAKSADSTFDRLTCLTFGIFMLDQALTSWLIQDYFLSLFFLVDSVATASLLMDLTWVWERSIGYGSFGSPALLRGDWDEVAALSTSSHAHLQRRCRIGIRITRMLRVFRLIQQACVVSRRCCHRRHRRKSDTWDGSGSARLAPGRLPIKGVNPGRSRDSGSLSHQDPGRSDPSLVGKRIAGRTTTWTMVIVIVMRILAPLLDCGDVEAMLSSSAQYGANVIDQMLHDCMIAEARSLSGGHGQAAEQQCWELERQVLLYVYYHNFYATCPNVTKADQSCGAQMLHKLMFLGLVVIGDGRGGVEAAPAALKVLGTGAATSDSLFSGRSVDWTRLLHIVGELPRDIEESLAKPWSSRCGEAEYTIYGLSLVRGQPCPWARFRAQDTVWYLPKAREPTSAWAPSQPPQSLVFLFDAHDMVTRAAAFGIAQTLVTASMLLLAAWCFLNDLEQLVLSPIRRMVERVTVIQKQPLVAARLDLYQAAKVAPTTCRPHKGSLLATLCRKLGGTIKRLFVFQTAQDKQESVMTTAAQHMKQLTSHLPVLKGGSGGRVQKNDSTFETTILENTIKKLGALLAIGLGEAGVGIIVRNMCGDEADVNVMVPGRTVDAVYGICEIKDFGATTDVLLEKTMLFVNLVARIVHRVIDEHLGTANKNVGEAFLLVWPTGMYGRSVRNSVADLSVIAFIMVSAEVNRDLDLAAYRGHPALLARLGSKYRVRVSFGLHIGWSVVGAVGSDFKVDTTYLSLHVNMAGQLASLTSKYHVAIIMSEALTRTCSESLSCKFRPIDYVKLPGVKVPTRLFTVDLDCEAVSVDKHKQPRFMNLDRLRMKRQRLDALSNGTYCAHSIFVSNLHIYRMRAVYFLEFFQLFEKGYLNYEAGEWDVALEILAETAIMLKGRCVHNPDMVDGPSIALLNYMREQGCNPPVGWRGYNDMAEGVRSQALWESSDLIPETVEGCIHPLVCPTWLANNWEGRACQPSILQGGVWLPEPRKKECLSREVSVNSVELLEVRDDFEPLLLQPGLGRASLDSDSDSMPEDEAMESGIQPLICPTWPSPATSDTMVFGSPKARGGAVPRNDCDSLPKTRRAEPGINPLVYPICPSTSAKDRVRSEPPRLRGVAIKHGAAPAVRALSQHADKLVQESSWTSSVSEADYVEFSSGLASAAPVLINRVNSVVSTQSYTVGSIGSLEDGIADAESSTVSGSVGASVHEQLFPTKAHTRVAAFQRNLGRSVLRERRARQAQLLGLRLPS